MALFFSHIAFEIIARTCFEATQHSKSLLKQTFFFHRIGKPLIGIDFRKLHSESVIGRVRQPWCARNHCSSVLRSHLAFEIAARAGFFVFGSTRTCCPASFLHVPLEIIVQQQGARNHCSGILRRSLAFEILAQAGFVLFECTLASPSQSLSKALCFELRIASSCGSCDFPGTVRRHMRI